MYHSMNTESFDQSEWDYINNHEDFIEKVKRFEQVFLNEGIEKGIEIGIEQGEYQEKRKTAINGIQKGYANNVISDLTGLSETEIEELRKQKD